jgi:hypothetical protein
MPNQASITQVSKTGGHFIYQGVRYLSLYHGRTEYKDVINKGSEDLFKEELWLHCALYLERGKMWMS